MTFQQHWTLNPDIDFLNHGSFGATPKMVLAAQRRYIDALERDPIKFLAPERDLESKLDLVRERLADLLGVSIDSLVFVRNATDGVNAVLGSFPLTAGDQVLVTDHGYNACTNAVRWAAERSGAETRVVSIPFPISSEQQVIEPIQQALNARTRLLVIDHVTSPTGLVFPVQKIIQAVKAQGVRVLVDGAHAPGMVPLQLLELDADFYTGNHHKWLCAPKASGFLYIAPQYRDQILPTVISHGANRDRPGRTRLHTLFDWVGTFDPTPLLAVTDSLNFLASLRPGGIGAHMEANRKLALAARSVMIDALEIAAPAPESMIGSLVSVPLPRQAASSGVKYDALQQHLYDDHGIEVPIFRGPKENWVLRVSLQAYNTIAQIERLAEILKDTWR